MDRRMTEKGNEQAILESWQRNATPWTNLIRHQSISSRCITDPAIVETIAALQPKRVLDVGCGEGWLCRALCQHGIHSTGIDAIDTLVEAARQQHPPGEYLQLPYGDIPGPLAGRHFDAVVCNFSLFGDQSVSDLIPTLGSLLAPQGHLLIQTLHPAMSHQGDYREGWRSNNWQGLKGNVDTPFPWYFRSFSGWLSLIQSHGFRVTVREPLCPDTHQPLSLILTARKQEL